MRIQARYLKSDIMRPRTTVKYCTANCSNGTANGCYITCGIDGRERKALSKCDVLFDAIMCNKCKVANAYNSKEVRCVTGEIRGKEDSCNKVPLLPDSTGIKDVNNNMINVGDIVTLEGVNNG